MDKIKMYKAGVYIEVAPNQVNASEKKGYVKVEAKKTVATAKVVKG